MLNFYFKSTFSMKPGKFQLYFINNCRITNTSNLFDSTKKLIDKIKNEKNVASLEVFEVVLFE